MAKVTKWPLCRNTAVKKCFVNGTNPLLPSSTGLRKATPDGVLALDESVTVECADGTKVHDLYVDKARKIELKCKYGGLFEVPTSLSSCRSPKNCTGGPPGDATLAVDNSTTPVASLEFQTTVYKCADDKFTLDGVPHPMVKSGKLEVACRCGG